MIGYQCSGIGADVEGVDGLMLGTVLILALEGLRKILNNFSIAISGLRFEYDAPDSSALFVVMV
jgi:hypothetical protein